MKMAFLLDGKAYFTIEELMWAGLEFGVNNDYPAPETDREFWDFVFEHTQVFMVERRYN